MEIKFTSNVELGAAQLAEFKKSVTWKAMRRSMTRTLQGTRAYASKEIRKSKIAILSAEEIKANIRARLLGERSGAISDLVGSVYFYERNLSIMRMHARIVRTGRRVGIEARTIEGRPYRVGFPVVMTSSALSGSTKKKKASIVRRITKQTYVLMRKGKSRYPLKKAFGASLTDIVRHSSLEENITRYAKMRLAREVQQNLNHYARQAIR